MNHRLSVVCCLGALAVSPVLEPAHGEVKPPNIVVILADDLGYGDVRCFNPDGKIATPNLDRLASEGMRFTDAHTSSAVCTPTRYGLLTGRYNWRTRLQSGVLGGLSPRLIEPGRMTLASFLKERGYHTACVGKWHLGMDWVLRPGKSVTELNIEPREQVWNVDYAQPIANGPNSVGFDEYFGISASLDMVPYTFIRDDRVTVLPTEDRDFPLMLGRAQGRCRQGPAAPGFEVENVLPELAREAVAYVERRAADAKRGRPFFLYWPLASPHTPIVPAPEWHGKSGLNPYGDFVMQTDHAVGELLQTLDRRSLTEDTLVFLTSDNGCSPQADFPALLARGHNPSYVFRGHKADIYEGGHRVPFLVRWPGRVVPGSVSDQLICLTDLLATCAEILGARLPASVGEDSVSILPALLGRAQPPLHEAVVHHSINGSFAIRQGRWKLAVCPGSGGWSAPRPGRDDTRHLPPVQLFDLEADIGERKNVQREHPEVVHRLTALLERFVAEGRSTPGPAQANAVAVDVHAPEQAGR
jgi:arylsulfatase A-like enzyme